MTSIALELSRARGTIPHLRSRTVVGGKSLMAVEQRICSYVRPSLLSVASRINSFIALFSYNLVPRDPEDDTMSYPTQVDTEITPVGYSSAEKDLESQLDKKATVTVTPMGTTSDRPMLGRRKTTGSLNASGLVEQTETLAYDTDEDALTKIGNFLWKVRISVYRLQSCSDAT